MTLILDNDQVRRLLTMQDCIAAMEEAYGDLALGRGAYRVRTDIVAPTERADTIYSLKSMDGVVPALGVGAIRINSDILRYRREGERLLRDKVPAAPNKRYVGFVLVFGMETGEPLLIYPDGVIQTMRVAAVTALGMRHLARRQAHTVGLLGGGWQARSQVAAANVVLDHPTILCHSPNAERCQAFCQEMRDEHGFDVRPAATPEEAVRGADIVLCATNSRNRVFQREWIEPGMHVSCINMFEIDADVVNAADLVATHIRECDPIFIKAGDMGTLPEEPGGGYQNLAVETDYANLPTIAEYVAGTVPGRTSDDQVSCMVNSVGSGYQFAVVGAVLARRAREEGLGTEIPTEWFTEVEVS
jgi:alanine dehydrogenase